MIEQLDLIDIIRTSHPKNPTEYTIFSSAHGTFSGTDHILGFPGDSAGKEFACNAGDLRSIPGLGRSPGERNSYPLQYSGHILGHKTSLNKLKGIEIISGVFSDHKNIELEINHRKRNEKKRLHGD